VPEGRAANIIDPNIMYALPSMPRSFRDSPLRCSEKKLECRIDQAPTPTLKLQMLGIALAISIGCSSVSKIGYRGEPYGPILSEESKSKMHVEHDAKRHVDAVGIYQSRASKLQNGDEEICRSGKSRKPNKHEKRLLVQRGHGCDRSNERLGHSINGQERDVIAVANEHAAGVSVAPSAPGNKAEKHWSGRRPDGTSHDAQNSVEPQHVLEEIPSTADSFRVQFRLFITRGTAKLRKGVAACLFDGLEKHPRNQASIIGRQGIGALLSKRNQGGNEEAVALGEEIL
jgi:hypothetical protein